MIFIDRQGEAASAVFDALGGADCVARLERDIEAYSGKRCVALCSVDAAIHTALRLCGVRDGDYVFVPTFTFYSYIASVCGAGGVPVFLDCDPRTRCVSAAALETAFLWSELQGKLPKAVVVDNAFGSVADFDTLVPQCKARGIPLVELAADAFHGEYKSTPCGANGDYGVIAFDKRLAGGGGALICSDDDMAAARMFTRVEYSDAENHDYRMHNAVAAFDCAQKGVSEQLAKRARKNLAALAVAADGAVVTPVEGDAAMYALCAALPIAKELRKKGYDVKKPPLVHTLPQYADRAFFEHEQGYSVCKSFDKYCLIGMDMSVIARMRLIKLFRTNGLI